MKWFKRILVGGLSLGVVLVGCSNPSPAGRAPFVYLAEPEDDGFKIIEYYPNEGLKHYLNKRVPGMYYRNAYYDGQKLYVSLSNAFFIYDSVTKKVKELPGIISNAIKKINGEIWVATDNGLQPGRYSSSLCKINEAIELDCLYDISNQQVDDFYIDFERQVFYASGPGVPEGKGGMHQEYKIIRYDMRTGDESPILNDGQQIQTYRLSNICPGQFITDDGDLYRDTGEKLGQITGARGQKVMNAINDVTVNEATFLDYDNNLLEVYGCEDGQVTHRRTILLNYEPNTYPGYHSWETTDEGEITLPINEEDDNFSFIGFQSINLRTGKVEVHIFDQPVENIHAVARFV